MGYAVVRHRVYHGIAEDDLAIVLRGRVVVEHGLHVGIYQPLDLGQRVNEPEGQPLAGGQHVVLLALVANCSPVLSAGAAGGRALHRDTYLVGAQLFVVLPAVEVVGEDDALDEAYDGLNVAHGGQRCLQGGWHHAALVVGMLRGARPRWGRSVSLIVSCFIIRLSLFGCRVQRYEFLVNSE